MAELFGVPAAMSDEDWNRERLVEDLRQSYALLSQYDKEALSLYEPQANQAAIHACRARNVLVTGGNQSGKTLTCVIDDARCVTNQDPYDKYPKSGLLVLIGFGWKHIGTVFYPKLFKPGAFKIIRDRKTRKWRAYRPWTEEDADRAHEAEDAPPLISPRFYDPKDIAWEYRGQDQIAKVRLKTGWEIWCYSSESDPDGMQGFQADRVHIDEDVNKEQFVSEAQARLIIRKGQFCWSAMPHSRNVLRGNMSQKAEEIKEKAKDAIERGEVPEAPSVVEFILPFTENAYIDAETKKLKMEEWAMAGEDVLRMRAYGHYTFNDQAMYPAFHMKFHGYKRSLLPHREVPKDWTRFAAIDPGSQVCAAIFGAIPPDGKMCLIYDELRLVRCDAHMFGEAMEAKCKGYEFESFIIDAHGARLRDIGGGRNVWDQYTEALEKRGVKSHSTGSSFAPGVDNKTSRAEAVRLALRANQDNQAFVRFLMEDNGAPATPALVKSIQNFRKKRCPRTDVVLDEPETRGDVHHAQTLEYLLAYPGLKYVAPRNAVLDSEPAWKRIKKVFDDFNNRGRTQQQTNVVHFGPASQRRNSA